MKCTDSSSAPIQRVLTPSDAAQLEHTFPEYEIVIEEENAEDVQTSELVKNAKVMETTTIWDDAGKCSVLYVWSDVLFKIAETPGGADEASDAAITQSDYNQAMGSEQHDPVYINFLSRIQQGGNDQVLRYRR